MKLETRYVKGLMRYMKIQNRGRLSGETRMPQKAYSIIPSSVANAPAISSLGEPAMSMCARELANKNVATMIRRVWKLRI
jgi:hypothetical protein